MLTYYVKQVEFYIFKIKYSIAMGMPFRTMYAF